VLIESRVARRRPPSSAMCVEPMAVVFREAGKEMLRRIPAGRFATRGEVPGAVIHQHSISEHSRELLIWQ
jgi:hypothetical protein